MLDASLISKRIGAVENTAASVVGIATWCTLHSQKADDVLRCIGERMRSPATTSDVRVSLLFVVHEMLLSCVVKGVPEQGKHAIIQAVGKILPGSVKAVAEDPNFQASLTKVLRWWSSLNLFPVAWFDGLRPPTSRHTSLPATSVTPSALLPIAKLMSKYESAKEKLNNAKERGDSTEQLSEAVSRRLSLLIKALDGRDESSPTGLLAVLEAERSRSSTATSDALKEDVLGSFF